MTTRFENLDSKTQDTIDKTLASINSIWTTWFPSSTPPTNTGGTPPPPPANTGDDVKPPVTPRTPPPPPKRSYKGLIYAGVGLGVIGVGFLIYKAVKKKA